MKNYSALLSDKVWPQAKNVLMAGLNGKYMNESMSLVLENTRQALLADTQMSNIVYLPKITLPLVRRLFPRLIAQDIVSVQPLKGPAGIIRFLDVYREYPDGSRTNLYPFGNDADVDWDALSTAPNALTYGILADGTDNTTKQFAGTIDKDWAEGTLGVFMGNAVTSSTTWTLIADVDKTGRVTTVDDGRPGVSGESTAKVMGAVDIKDRSYILNITDGDGDAIAKQIYFRFYSGGTDASHAKDFEYNIPFGDEKTYGTLKFDITRIPVTAKSRRLGANYSFEFIEDFQNEFGESFEDKVVDYLTTTITTEIDKEILSLLFNSAVHTATWDASMPGTWTRGIKEWYETIVVKLNQLSAEIYQQTHVAGATFIVCSPKVATIIQSMQNFVGSGNPTEGDMQLGTVKLGTLSNLYKVYVSPLCPANKILMGFKGNKPEETGCIYAPYIPVTLHPITYNQGIPSLMARTRYATQMVRPDFYGVLNVGNWS